MKQIYLMFVCTPSIVSKAIKKYTNDSYTHVAISIDPEMQEFYSFARRYSYSPLPAGFVKESLHSSFYKRNPSSQCKIVSLDVTEEQYNAIKRNLAIMYENRYDYKYNLLGLFLCNHNITMQRRSHRFCSEFVSEILKDNGVLSLEKLPQHIRPMELINLEQLDHVYEGTVMDYDSYSGKYGKAMVVGNA